MLIYILSTAYKAKCHHVFFVELKDSIVFLVSKAYNYR